MKLHAQNYGSPLSTEGTFTDVFIEDSVVKIEKFKKYLSVTFEMYHFKNNERVVLDERTLGFYGMNGDEITSKDDAIISIPNPSSEPITIEVLNPDYDPENPDSLEFITSTIPAPETINVPLLQYLSENNGHLPASYEVVHFGYPNFQVASQFFVGGDKNNLDIEIPNPFAKDWLKNCLVMKNEAIGTQFDFVD